MKKSGRIVIVGGGFGGLLVALKLGRQLKNKQHAPEIVLVDARDHHTYTPWLYAVATSQLAHEQSEVDACIECSSGIKFREIIRRNRVPIRFVQGRVTQVDHDTKSVSIEGEKTLSYTTLVLAYGSVVNDYGIKGVLKYARQIQSVEGSFALRNELAALVDEITSRRVVVVGSGAVGVETAAQLAHFLRSRFNDATVRHQVVMLTAGDSVLSRDKDYVRKHAQERLEQLGVEIRFGALLTAVGKDHVEYSQGKKSQKLESDLTIWAGGLKPNPAIKIKGLQQNQNRQFAPLPTLELVPDVYVLGDIAEIVLDDGRRVPGAAWVALGQSKVVAANILSDLRGGGRRRAYVPEKYWPSLILTGGSYGVATAFGVNLRGLPAFILRRLADLDYFLKIFPAPYAVWHWWKGAMILTQRPHED